MNFELPIRSGQHIDNEKSTVAWRLLKLNCIWAMKFLDSSPKAD